MTSRAGIEITDRAGAARNNRMNHLPSRAYCGWCCLLLVATTATTTTTGAFAFVVHPNFLAASVSRTTTSTSSTSRSPFLWTRQQGGQPPPCDAVAVRRSRKNIQRSSRVMSSRVSSLMLPPVQLALSARIRDDDDDEDLEYARVRRGGRGRRREPERYDDTDGEDDYDDNGSSSSSNPYARYQQDSAVNDDDDDDDDWDFIDDLEEQWEEDGYSDETMPERHDLLGNVLIPNPLLDSMDPDGAADRFPELARDPRFWFDMFLFFAFLDFLSFIGPRDPFPDLPLPYGPPL